MPDKPDIPESDPYRGIRWLLEAAEAMGDLPATAPETEDVAMAQNSSMSDHQPSDSQSMLQGPQSEDQRASQGSENAAETSPDSGNGGSSPPNKKAKKWSTAEKAKLIELRNPSREGGPMKYAGIMEVLKAKERSNLACRLQADKMKKAGDWPWTRA